MGVHVKWIRKLITFKKPSSNEPEVGGKVGRWRLCSRSSPTKDGSDGSVSPFILDSEMAQGFIVLHWEWAAIRIQTVFRAFLARRTLRSVQALVQTQARVQSKCAQSCTRDEQVDQSQPLRVKKDESGWCDQEEGPNWLKHWMATKPWDPRRMGKLRTDSFDSRRQDSQIRIRRDNASTRISPMCFQSSDPVKKAEVLISYIQPLMCNSCDQDSPVRIRRNNVSTRISPKVLMCFQPIHSFSDQPVCNTKQRYMKLTSSTKAKRCSYSSVGNRAPF